MGVPMAGTMATLPHTTDTDGDIRRATTAEAIAATAGTVDTAMDGGAALDLAVPSNLSEWGSVALTDSTVSN
jgi:hypothetical protein